MLGQTLIIFTVILTGVALGLYIKYDNMDLLVGIKWSAPSPIEWGSLIALGSITLSLREIEPFTAYYLSFIAAMGGGWLYECPGWIIGGFWPMAFFKINAIKVFFIEFQLFCLPILLYLVLRTKRYEQQFLIVPLIVLAVTFYALSPWLKIALPPYIGDHGYRWIVRLPVISMLYVFLYGVKGEKK